MRVRLWKRNQGESDIVIFFKNREISNLNAIFNRENQFLPKFYTSAPFRKNMKLRERPQSNNWNESFPIVATSISYRSRLEPQRRFLQETREHSAAALSSFRNCIVSRERSPLSIEPRFVGPATPSSIVPWKLTGNLRPTFPGTRRQRQATNDKR